MKRASLVHCKFSTIIDNILQNFVQLCVVTLTRHNSASHCEAPYFAEHLFNIFPPPQLYYNSVPRQPNLSPPLTT